MASQALVRPSWFGRQWTNAKAWYYARRLHRMATGQITQVKIPKGIPIQAMIRHLKSIDPSDIVPSFLLGRAQPIEWDPTRAIQSGLKQSTWVYACAMRMALALSTPEWFTEVRQPDGTWVRDDSHPLSRILECPNPEQTWSEMMQVIVLHLFLTGNAIISKIRVGTDEVQRLKRLWPINPANVRPIVIKGRGLVKYEIRVSGGTKIEEPRKDYVHLRFQDPGNPYWGLAPMQAADRAVRIDVEAAEWQINALKNNLIPPGIFKVKSIMSDEARQDFMEELEEDYMGALNARRPLIQGGDIEFQRISEPARELDFLGSRLATATEICAFMLTPPPLVGLLDRAQYNNIITVRKSWWEDINIPLLDLFRDAFNKDLGHEYPADSDGRPLVRTNYDASGVPAMRDIMKDRAELYVSLVGNGVPINAAIKLARLPLEPVAGGDVALVASNLLPLSLATTGETEI